MISFLTLLLTVGTSADSSADSVAALNAIAQSNSSTPISGADFNEEINKLLRRYPGNDAQNNQQSNSNPSVGDTGPGSAPQRGQQPQKLASNEDNSQDQTQPIGQRPNHPQYQQGQQAHQAQQGQQGRQNQYGQYPNRYNKPSNQGSGNQYGRNRYGQPPYGQPPYGQRLYSGGHGGGQSQYGQPQYGQGQYGQRPAPQGQPPQQGQYQGSNDQGSYDQGQGQSGQDQGSSYGHQQPYQGDSGEINSNIFMRKLQQICNKAIQTLIGYTADVIHGNTNPFSDGFDSATLKISRDISAVALAFRETPNGNPATYYFGQRILPPVIYDATLYTNKMYYKYINYHSSLPGSGQNSNSDPYADIPPSSDTGDSQFVQLFPASANSSTRTTSALVGDVLVAPVTSTAEAYNSSFQGQSNYGELVSAPVSGPDDSEEPVSSTAPVAPASPKQPKAPTASEAPSSQSRQKESLYALAPPINGPNNSQQQAPAPGAPGSGTLSNGQPLPQLRDTTVRHLQDYLSGMHELITVCQSYQVYTRDLEASVDNLEKFVQACTRSQY